MADWIKTAGGEFATGSRQLTYEGEIPEFAAVLFLENEEKSLSVNSRLRGRGEFSSTQLEGLWWAPNYDAQITIALSNTTEKKVTAWLAMTRHDGSELKSLAVPLGPHQTRVFSNRDLVARETELLGGVSITHDGRPGAVVAQSFVVDGRTGFSLNLPLFDPTKSGDAKLEGTGILLGGTTKEGEVPLRFSGRLLLRNVSPDAITATPALQQGAVRVELGEVWLEPGGSKEITVSPDAVVPGTPPTGIQITHTGVPGSLIGVWHSVDESGSLVVEAPLSAPRPSVRTAGAHPFSLEGDTSSVLYIKNTGSTTALFTAAIFYRGGDYMFGFRSVEPGETLAFDLRQIRDEQVPDFRGRELPRNLTAAQIQWFWRKGPAIIGRVNVMSRSKGISSNMSCPLGCSCNPRDAWLDFDPSLVDGMAGQIVNLHPVLYEQMCDGFTVSGTFYPNYFVADASVADVISSSGSVACYKHGQTEIDGTGEDTVYDVEYQECEEGPCERSCFSFPVELFALGSVRVDYCGDERDQIEQEYVDYSVNLTPHCADFTQSRAAVYFSFAEINVTSDYSWGLVRDPLIAPASSGYGLDAWRTQYGGPRIINSGYRNPAHNASIGGAAQSRHMYGDAADLRNQSGTMTEWQAMVDAAVRANRDFVEPSTGPCGLDCVHADWRFHVGGYH